MPYSIYSSIETKLESILKTFINVMCVEFRFIVEGF